MKEACSGCDWVRAKRQCDFYRSSNEKKMKAFTFIVYREKGLG